MIVNYYPEGIAVSDFEDIEKLIMEHYWSNHNVNTSSQLVVEMARILFLEGKIDSLQIQFNGQVIKIKDNGMFESWPEGFCDLNEKLARRLLKILVKVKHKQPIP
jgi:hypothetical protein